MLSVFLFASLALAKGDPASPENAEAFYRDSLRRHPLVEAATFKTQEGDAELERAGQWKNPDLELKTLSGRKDGESVGSADLSLTVPLSQFWTRGARQEVARAEKKRAEVESQESLLAVKKDLIRDLYRFRQINDEMNLIEETLKTFSTIQNQFRARRARSPEQDITLNLVELASSDYELKKNLLATERLEILSRMRVIWGPHFEMKTAYLPRPKERWPTISATMQTQRNLEVQKALADTEKAIAENHLANRESWPEVRLGPTMERTTESSGPTTSYGVALSMTLPLVSWNAGGRKLAHVRTKQAQFLADYTERKAELESQIHLQKYNAALESMRKSFRVSDLQKRHETVDDLFRRGLASGGLVIEAHRQLSEYTRSQHEHENAAVESFLELKTLRGEDLEEILQ